MGYNITFEGLNSIFNFVFFMKKCNSNFLILTYLAQIYFTFKINKGISRFTCLLKECVKRNMRETEMASRIANFQAVKRY